MTTSLGNQETIDNMISVGDFAEISDDFLEEHGINKGDLIYVAGNTVVPTDGKDPYAMRMLFIAAKTKEDHVDVKAGAFTVDGLRLKKVSAEEQERLTEIKRDDFGEK